MKRLLLVGTVLLIAGAAIAADNYGATEGLGKTFRCIENTAICYPVFTPSNSTGTTWVYGNGATGTASPRVTLSNDNTIPTGWPTAALQGTVTTWAGSTLGTISAYGTSPGAVTVPAVNAFVTNVNSNGQATAANSSPVVLSSDKNVSASPYPIGATPITVSATGTTGAITAALPGTGTSTTYICGYSIRANATAATTVTNTISGVVTATMSSTFWVAPLASGIGIDEQIFVPCIPASAAATGITVVSGPAGSGGTGSVKAWGYKLAP